MKKLTVAGLCVVVFFAAIVGCAPLKSSTGMASPTQGIACPSGSDPVIVLYPAFDIVGPGFAYSRPESPQLGDVAQEACYEKGTDKIVAWRTHRGYNFFYSDWEGDMMIDLAEKYGKIDADSIRSSTTILPGEKKLPKGTSVNIWFLR